MNDDRFDYLTRVLASPNSRRTMLKLLAGSTLTGAIAASQPPAALAKPDEKVTICFWNADTFEYSPKYLPPPAAKVFVDQGKADYAIDTDYDTYCAFPCGPDCLICQQRPVTHTCNKCIGGVCTCPDADAGTFSFQGGPEGTTPLLGTSYQIFNYDETTQTIGAIALSGVQTVTDAATGIVVFGPYPGDAPVCIREVSTPAGYTLIGHDFACLHLGCADQFLWDFRHNP
jgi:hypothetical protein